MKTLEQTFSLIFTPINVRIITWVIISTYYSEVKLMRVNTLNSSESSHTNLNWYKDRISSFLAV